MKRDKSRMDELHNSEQERFYEKNEQLRDEEKQSFIWQNLQQDGNPLQTMITMDASVAAAESADRKEKSVFQNDPSQDNPYVLARRTYQTCSKAMLTDIEEASNRFKEKGIDRNEPSSQVHSSRNYHITNWPWMYPWHDHCYTNK